MRIAILSDIHDHVSNLEEALKAARDVDELICCGDLCSPFIVDILARDFPGPIHLVFGNNDGDLCRITENANRSGRVQIHKELLVREFAGKRFAANHYPEIALGLARSGEFDVVCYGHDHLYRVEPAETDPRTINPGAIMGYDAVKKQYIPATFIIYDTQKHEARGYEIKGSETKGAGGRTVVPFRP